MPAADDAGESLVLAITAPRPRALLPVLPRYAELHCRSNFSFLTGASHPEELVERAAALGYGAIAITDECSLAGVVRAHVEAQAQKLPLVIGSEMRLTDAETGAPHARLVLLAQSRRGYGNLAHWITVARRRVEKGHYRAHPGDVEGKVPNAPMLAGLGGCFALLVPSAAQGLAEILRPRDLAQDLVPGARGDRHRAAPSRRRRRSRRPRHRGRGAHRSADRRRRRRADARPLAEAPAGHADRDAPRQAGGRVRPRARAQRRAAPALEEPPGRALRAGVARADDGDRRRLQVLARRAEVRVPAGDRAAGRDAGVAAAEAHLRGRAEALSATACPTSTGRRSSTSSGSSPSSSTSPTSSPSPTSSHWAREREHPVPGPRQRRQLAGLLLPARHRGRPAPRQPAVRPLHQRRAQGAARHRHRLRAPAARGGDPVHLRQVRPAPRRAHRRRHQLPAALGAARRRPRSRHRPAADRGGVEEPALVRRPRHRRPSGCARTASIPSRPWSGSGWSSPAS